MDPRNNNPFTTDDNREPRSEYAANKELAKTAKRDDLSDSLLSIGHFADMPKDEFGFWK